MFSKYLIFKKKQYKQKKNLTVDEKTAEAAAITIQATFRGYKTRKEIRPRLAVKQQRAATIHTSSSNKKNPISVENKSTEQQVEAAATTKATPILAETTNNINNSSQRENAADSNGSKDLDQAAIKIQATYRGFRTRKELQQKKGDHHG